MRSSLCRLLHLTFLLLLMLITITIASTATTFAATKATAPSHTITTKAAKPACSASVYFSPTSQTTHLHSTASVTAAVTCSDWLWGTDVAFNWGDGTGWYVQNTKDYTTFTHTYARTGAYTAYGHVNGVPGNNVEIIVIN